ncbi:MAG TPA: metallophosphoesterase [Longimicrobium sp.]|jgi:alkaline phosphatase|uniref:metallophosphoesterase family protein n=1 Tax=Longimicrobium sp. TaxID=2029185 RepID=UPI002EDA0E88
MTGISMRAAVPWAAAFLLAAAACGGDGSGARGHTSLVAAGDISSCYWSGDEATARLIDDIPGVVVPLGDVVYQRGTEREFRECYAPTWGRHRDRSRPTIGNHEWRTRRGEPYFRYFGERAGPAGKGWYSYELDGWHVIVLNSNLPIVDGSEQMEWLREDLKDNEDTRCTLAYFHHPVFSSGDHGGTEKLRELWEVLQDGGVDVVLSGHDHNYERFAPQNARARADRRGIRQFVVGTGGAPSYRVPPERQPNSQAFGNDVRGVLRMDLQEDGYAWEFVPIPGRNFTDAGRAECR